jgi:DNA gyrase subunit A
VTEQGYGKRTELDEYRVQSRGGVGIINIQTSERNGKVIGVAQVTGEDELMLITQQGKILRMAASNIRSIGRATQGVRLIDIEGEDRAVSIARLAEKDEERLAEKIEESTGEVLTDEKPDETTDDKGEE